MYIQGWIGLIGLIGGSIAIIGLIRYVGWRMYRRVWPGREGWQVRYMHGAWKKDDTWRILDIDTSSDLQRTLNRNNRLFWHSETPQQKGDFYQIDLDKERIISGFYELDFESCLAVPLQYSLSLYNKGGDKKTEPNHIAREPITGRGRAYEEFPPIKVQRITVKIIEPNRDKNRNPYFWIIYGFELREVMVLARIITRRI